MGHYRKKPVVIEALQWDASPSSSIAIREWTGDTGPEYAIYDHPAFKLSAWSEGSDHADLWVEKSHAWCCVEPGMWVIAEADRVGFYPCTAEQFAASYEEVQS